MDMPIPDGAPPMPPMPMPGGEGGAPIESMLVQTLGQMRRLAEDNGLDFDKLVQASEESGEGESLPPPPPSMDEMPRRPLPGF